MLVSYASVRLGQVRLVDYVSGLHQWRLGWVRLGQADYVRGLHQAGGGQVTAQTMPPSHNQYHDLVILPFLVNDMSLLYKPSKFPLIWWVTSPAYIIHQNFLFWKFHQNHSPKIFPFLEIISKFGKSFQKRNFLFWKKCFSRSKKISSKNFLFWKVT